MQNFGTLWQSLLGFYAESLEERRERENIMSSIKATSLALPSDQNLINLGTENPSVRVCSKWARSFFNVTVQINRTFSKVVLCKSLCYKDFHLTTFDHNKSHFKSILIRLWIKRKIRGQYLVLNYFTFVEFNSLEEVAKLKL